MKWSGREPARSTAWATTCRTACSDRRSATASTTKGGSVALAFEKDLGDDWGMNGKARYASYDHEFGLCLDGDGMINVPETLAELPQSRRSHRYCHSHGTRPAGRGAGNGCIHLRGDRRGLPADALLFANRFTDRDRPADDISGRAEPDQDDDARRACAQLHARRVLCGRPGKGLQRHHDVPGRVQQPAAAGQPDVPIRRRGADDQSRSTACSTPASVTSTTSHEANARRSTSPTRWRATSSSSTSARRFENHRRRHPPRAHRDRRYGRDDAEPAASACATSIWGNGRVQDWRAWIPTNGRLALGALYKLDRCRQRVRQRFARLSSSRRSAR